MLFAGKILNACNTYKNTSKRTITFITVLIFEFIGTKVLSKYKRTPTIIKVIKKDIICCLGGS